MDDSTRDELVKMGWHIHGAVEDAFLRHPATRADADGWREKQRLLLADMAVHLLQTALKPGDVDIGKLKDNLHAILTISDQFLPHAGLKKATENLYVDPGPG